MEKYVIGVDFGTLSGRALLVPVLARKFPQPFMNIPTL